MEVNSLPSLSETVRQGKTFESLEALRDQIALDLEACESMRDKAALYLRMADVLARIDEVRPVEVKGDAVDEIAARRAARRASSAASAPRTKRSS